MIEYQSWEGQSGTNKRSIKRIRPLNIFAHCQKLNHYLQVLQTT